MRALDHLQAHMARATKHAAMTAETIAKALGGRKVRGGWMARCPAHPDHDPSLSIGEASDGKILVHCFAGCGQAQVIDALRGRGLWATNYRHHAKITQPRQSAHDQRDRDDAERTARALSIWHQARPGAGTIVATYLRCRGFSLEAWPATIRFHSECCRPRDDAGNFVLPLPAMLALVEHVQRGPVAVHATYLRPDGSDKADIPKREQKVCFGPVLGGAVRLGPVRPDEWLAIGEGIETTLSVMQACALPGWAALSAAGIKSLILPPDATMALICADNDAGGAGQRAAREATERFLREGRRVGIAMPPTPATDFNDVLNSAAPACFDEEARHVG
jgi:putative DNA primase/helicase